METNSSVVPMTKPVGEVSSRELSELKPKPESEVVHVSSSANYRATLGFETYFE